MPRKKPKTKMFVVINAGADGVDLWLAEATTAERAYELWRAFTDLADADIRRVAVKVLPVPRRRGRERHVDWPTSPDQCFDVDLR